MNLIKVICDNKITSIGNGHTSVKLIPGNKNLAYTPFNFFTASMILGITSNASPTIP
jgi:hypothetical protein